MVFRLNYKATVIKIVWYGTVTKTDTWIYETG